MADDPQITFAIPYYRNLDYLREAIDSVVAQTMPRWSVVVVDDAGPEPADELVQTFADPRITSSRNANNLGLARNWNACLTAARSDLVTLLHADDRVRPTYGADVIAAADHRRDVSVFFTDAVIIDDEGKPARSFPDFVKRFARRPDHDHEVSGDDGLAAILSNNYVMCPTVCFRRSLVGAEPFDPRWQMTLDLDHMARLLMAGQSMYAIRRPLYEYRRHGANQTSTLTADTTRFDEEISCYREIANAADALGWSRSATAARRRLMVRMHLALQAGNDAAHGRWSAAGAKRRLLWSDLRPRPRC